jgi:hypothetical protein
LAIARLSDYASAAGSSLSSLRLLFVAWLILAAFVANDSLIGLSVDLFYRLIYVGPVCGPLPGRCAFLARVAHGFSSDRIKVFISTLAAGRDRLSNDSSSSSQALRCRAGQRKRADNRRNERCRILAGRVFTMVSKTCHVENDRDRSLVPDVKASGT